MINDDCFCIQRTFLIEPEFHMSNSAHWRKGARLPDLPISHQPPAALHLQCERAYIYLSPAGGLGPFLALREMEEPELGRAGRLAFAAARSCSQSVTFHFETWCRERKGRQRWRRKWIKRLSPSNSGSGRLAGFIFTFISSLQPSPSPQPLLLCHSHPARRPLTHHRLPAQTLCLDLRTRIT